MINLYVFRHGQSIYQCLRLISGLHEYGLSALGKYQAYSVASNIDIKFDMAFVSDTRRTYETYELLKLAGRMPSLENCIMTPLLREKNQGDFTLQDFSVFPDNNHDRLWKVDNGENWEDVQERVKLTMQFIIGKYLQQKTHIEGAHPEVTDLFNITANCNINTECPNIMLVTHQGFIKELVLYLKIKMNDNSNAMPYFAQNAALFRIQINYDQNDWHPKIISMNSYSKQYRPFM